MAKIQRAQVFTIYLFAFSGIYIGESMPLMVFGMAKIQRAQVFTIYLFAFSGIYIGESVPLVVFGMAKIQRVQMLAELSGLKLEAELRKVHATGTYKKKVKGVYISTAFIV